MWVRPEYNKKWRTEQADFCKGVILHPSGAQDWEAFRMEGIRKPLGEDHSLETGSPEKLICPEWVSEVGKFGILGAIQP